MNGCGRGRDVVAVSGVRPADRVEQGRRVADGAGQRELVGEAADRLPHRRPDRDAPPGRLQPDQAAPGGGDPDRAAAVVAVTHRERSGRHQRRRAPARAPRAAGRVPGIQRRAVDGRGGVDVEGELGRRGAHQRHQAGGAEAAHERRLAAGDVAVEQAAPEPERPSRLGQGVLDREWHPGERPVGRRGVLVRATDDRVQARLHGRDGAQGRVADLVPVHLTGRHQARQLGRVGCCVVREIHVVDRGRDARGAA